MPDQSATAMTSSLQVRTLHLWRGDRHLLRGVNLSMREGELVQVVGPNGVGKTSLLRCIAGLLPMESGEVQWCGRALQDCREQFQRDLSYLAHTNALKNELTALENLRYSVGLRRAVDERELTEALERVQIAACASIPARSLSAGQKRRLAIGRILLSHTKLWILDEPITNLDSAGVALFESCLAMHLNHGGMVLTAAHQLLLQGQPNVRTLELH